MHGPKVATNINCKPGPFQQVNQISHWLDGSNIYGSSIEESKKLRSFQDGLLNSQISSDGAELLPEGLWQYRLWSFQGRDTKLERFLAKDQL